MYTCRNVMYCINFVYILSNTTIITIKVKVAVTVWLYMFISLFKQQIILWLFCTIMCNVITSLAMHGPTIHIALIS